MSLFDDFENKFRSKLADYFVTLIFKIAPLALGSVGAMLFAKNIDPEVIVPGRLEAVDFQRFLKGLFLISFFMAIVAATTCSLVVRFQRVAVPMCEAARLRKVTLLSGVVGFVSVFGIYAALLGGNPGFERFLSKISDPGLETVSFWAGTILVVGVVYFLAYSILCFWLLPRPLQIMAQPGLVRWIPRTLNRLQLGG